MAEYELLQGVHIAPTPAGAYFAVSSPVEDRARATLIRLLSKPSSPPFQSATLGEISGATDPQEGLEHVYRLQELGLVQGLSDEKHPPSGALETSLPGILAELAGRGKAMLADEQGFYLATHGFHHETAEELAGLSADLGSMHTRHLGLIDGNLGLHTSAWALINAGGLSEMGFWPLFIGRYRFVLIVSGTPNLNQPAMLDLVWMLFRRYGT
ncbi:MAG: hypothetical protein FNT29_10085 [Halothiobacillaceae bacterium]|jgi:hypothetical protein|nr:MAG: hypothetical protein FNT29_10085 [Halothiobacillaceae bacterium]